MVLLLLLLLLLPLLYFNYAAAIIHKERLILAIRVRQVYCSRLSVPADLCQLRSYFLHNIL